MKDQLFSKKNIYEWIIGYLFMQSFLTLISLPILIEWGLGISFTGFLGNCLFAPFISLYLALSFFIFFTELCSLPNFFFIFILEKITSVWIWLTEFLGSAGLYFLATPRPYFFYLLILFSFSVIATSCSIGKKTVLLACLLIFTVLSLSLFGPSRYGIDLVSLRNKPLIILCLRGVTIGVDYGALSKSEAQKENFIRYTLKPLLIKKYGKESLDMLIFPNSHF